MARTVLLFDIDMTLMRSGGAGLVAMNRAFEELTGVPTGFAGIDFGGRTDRWILAEACRRAGLDEGPLWDPYCARYPGYLREELARATPFALPGVGALLADLSVRPQVTLAVATGNQRAAAYCKLEAVGLDHYFTFGGFGDDHVERPLVLQAALTSTGWRAGERLIVIGDTEHDVAAAHAVGAFALAVATGSRDSESLAAAGADAVLPDLADLAVVLPLLLGVPPSEEEPVPAVS